MTPIFNCHFVAAIAMGEVDMQPSALRPKGSSCASDEIADLWVQGFKGGHTRYRGGGRGLCNWYER